MKTFITTLILTFAMTAPADASERIESSQFTFVHEYGRSAMAKELARRANRMLKEVTATLGNTPNDIGKITVSIHHGATAFNRAIAKWGARVEWAAGIAIPSANQILLRVDAQTRFSIHDVFRHELSHVALYHAVGGHKVPRWFNEGIAVYQAGERILERWQRTADASLSDGLIPFAALTNGFPANGLRADLAYAQSTSLVGFLIRLHGWQAIRILLSKIAAGSKFNPAVGRVFGRSMQTLEREWRLEVERRASWIPFLTGTGILWIVISGLFVLSWAVNRHRTRQRMEAMDDPELDDEYA